MHRMRGADGHSDSIFRTPLKMLPELVEVQGVCLVQIDHLSVSLPESGSTS